MAHWVGYNRPNGPSGRIGVGQYVGEPMAPSRWRRADVGEPMAPSQTARLRTSHSSRGSRLSNSEADTALTTVVHGK
jgi:hypothetical protein